MAKKLTKEQKHSLLVDSYFGSGSSVDPEVEALQQRTAANKKAEEDAAKQKRDAAREAEGRALADKLRSETEASKPEPSLAQKSAYSLLGESLGQKALDAIRPATSEVGSILDDSLLGGIIRSGAAQGFTASDNDVGSMIGQSLNAAQNPMAAMDLANRVNQGQTYTDSYNPLASGMGEVYKHGQAKVDEGDKFAKTKSVLPSSVSQAIHDVAASPSSLASLPGGAFAVLPSADTFAQEYTSARLAGVDKAPAALRAGVQATIEGGVEAVPTLGFLEKIGLEKPLAEAIRGRVAGVATNLLGTGLAEGGEEAVTTAAQLGVDKLTSLLTSDKAVQEFTSQQTLDFWEQMRRSTAAGFAGGAGMGAPHAFLHDAAQRGQIASDAIEQNNKALAELRAAAGLRRPLDAAPGTVGTNAIAPVTQGDLFGTPASAPSFEEQQANHQKNLEIDAGLAVGRRQQAVHDDHQKVIDGARYQLELEQQRAEELRSKLEDGSYSQADANSYTASVARQAKLEEQVKHLEDNRPALPAPVDTTVAGDTVVPQQGQLSLEDTQREAKRAEARDMLKREQESINTKAKAARAAAYRKHGETLRTQYANLPDEQRVEKIAEGLDNWNTENPLDNFITEAKTKAQTPKPEKGTKAPVTQVNSPVNTNQQVETPITEADRAPYRAFNENATDEEIDHIIQQDRASTGLKGVDQLRQSATLPSTEADTNVPTTDTTPEHVLSTIADRMGSKDNAVAAKLIADGNMVIVDDVSQVPNAAEPRGRGFYDGNKTYIVANRVDPKNVMGDVMEVAAHEVKHGADFGASEALRGKLANIIGQKANAMLVQKIEQLGKVDPQVGRMVEAVKQAEPKNYQLELPAYAFQLGQGAKQNAGPLTRILMGVAGVARNQMRERFGANLDITVADLAHLSDRLLSEVANDGGRLKGDLAGPALPTIAGRSATGYKDSLRNGTVYSGADLLPRFAFSDAGAELNLNPLINSNESTLDQVLPHAELEKQYPDMAKGVKVEVDPNKREGAAHYVPFPANKIVISEKDVNAAMSDGKKHGKLRDLIIHELQHVVQEHEGFARGADVKEFLSPEDKQAVDGYHAAVDTLNKMGEGGNPVYKKTLQDKVAELAPRAKAALTESTQKYLRTYGEKEARFSQENSRKTQQELDSMNVRQAVENQNDVGPSIVLKPDEAYTASSEPLASKANILNNGQVAADATHDFVTKWGGKIVDFLKSQGLETGGLGYDVLKLFERNQGEAARADTVALHSARRLDAGIDKMAQRTGRTEKDIRDDLSSKMDALAQIPDKTRREAMLAGFVRSNPELEPLMDGVREINRLSRVLLGQLLTIHPNPTEKQLALMNAIDSNMFKYFTRSYAAFEGQAGRDRSEKLVLDALRVLKRGINSPKITKQQRSHYQTYMNAVNYLMANDLTIPERGGKDGLHAKRASELAHLYGTWINTNVEQDKDALRREAAQQGLSGLDIDDYVREKMIEALDAKRATLTDKMKFDKAKSLIPELLGINETGSPIAKLYRGLAQDRTILNARVQIPQELRDLFGEIKDPAIRVLVTLAKQGELVARNSLLLRIKEEGLGKWVVPTTEAFGENEKFSAELKGESLGPLNGYSTTPEFNRILNQTVELMSTTQDAMGRSLMNSQIATNEYARLAIRGITTVGRTSKVMTVVADGFGTIMNMGGSPFELMKNGVYDLRYIKHGVGLENIKHTLFNNAGEPTPMYLDALKYGLLDSGRAQELRKSPQRFIRDAISTKPESFRKATGVLRTAGRTAVETFATSDAWVKVPIWKARIDDLTSFYKAEGITKTEDEIKLEAANDVRNTTIGYGRTPPIIKNLESTGILTYAPYFYSTFRSLGMNTALGLQDLHRAMNANTIEGKMTMGYSGMKRIAGTSAVLYIIPHLFKSLSTMLSDDDDDKVEEMRKLLPTNAQFDDSVYMGKDHTGVPLFFRMSRIDQYGPVTDIIRTLMQDGVAGEDKATRAGNAVKDLVFANRAMAAVLKFAYGTLTDNKVDDRNTRLERVFPHATTELKKVISETTPIDNQNIETIVELLNSVTPGWVDTIDQNNTNVEQGSEFAQTVGLLTIATGGRLDRADPQQSAKLLSFALDDLRKEGRKAVAKDIIQGNDVAPTFTDYAEKEYKQMRELRYVYQGMVNGLGMSPNEAGKQLKSSGRGLTDTDIAGIRQGRVLQDSEAWIKDGTRLLNSSSVTQLADSETQTMTPEEKKAYIKKLGNQVKALRAAGYKVRD